MKLTPYRESLLKVALVTLMAIPVAVCTADDKSVDWDALVGSLKSQRPAPRLREHHRRTDAPANFDFKEQSRILGVTDKLVRNVEAAWPSLADNIDNPAYCLTLHEDYSTETSRNYSVGQICELILLESLTAAHLPHQPGTIAAWQKLRWPAILPEKRDTTALKEWFRKQGERGQPLYELQIELCEWAIEKIPAMASNEEDKTESIRGLEREIQKLKKTKLPVLLKSILTPETRTVWHPRDKDAPIEDDPFAE
jgi:hypothetical protein